VTTRTWALWCRLFGHIDKTAVGRLDQVVCVRCGRKVPPDTTAEDIRAWYGDGAPHD
jgi:hypothetical protein